MQPLIHMTFRFKILAPAIVLAAAPCHGHGGYHEELRLCDERIAADPDNAELWFHRGRLDYLHGDWMRSLLDLEKTEQLAPGRYPVELARGQAWMAGEKYPQARKALDAFVKSRPDVAEGFATRARLMLKLGNPDAAAADFRQALALTKSPEPDLYVEISDALIAGNHPQDAIRELDAGIKKLGIIPSLADKALGLELSLGCHDAALTRVESIRKSSPRPEPWMARRAAILAQAGRLDESRAAWSELRDHLSALPANERGSHAMSLLLEQARNALESLDNTQPDSVR